MLIEFEGVTGSNPVSSHDVKFKNRFRATNQLKRHRVVEKQQLNLETAKLRTLIWSLNYALIYWRDT